LGTAHPDDRHSGAANPTNAEPATPGDRGSIMFPSSPSPAFVRDTNVRSCAARGSTSVKSVR